MRRKNGFAMIAVIVIMALIGGVVVTMAANSGFINKQTQKQIAMGVWQNVEESVSVWITQQKQAGKEIVVGQVIDGRDLSMKGVSIVVQDVCEEEIVVGIEFEEGGMKVKRALSF